MKRSASRDFDGSVVAPANGPPFRHVPSARGPSWWQTYRWVRGPIAFLDFCAASCGDTFYVDVRGWGRHLILTRADDIRAVMASPDTLLSTGTAASLMMPVLGSHSLFTLDGPAHAGLRRQLIAGLRTNRYASLVQETIVEALPRFPVGAVRLGALHDWFKSMSMAIIVALLSGQRDQNAADKLIIEFERLFTHSATFLMLLPRIQQIDWPATPGRRFRRHLQRLDGSLAELIRSGNSDTALLSGIDFSGFGSAADQAKRDTAISVIAAGYETVATALAWLAWHLSANKAAQNAARASLANDGADKVIESACAESLRLMPTIEIVSRTAMRDCNLNGIRVNAGTLVSPCVFLANRNSHFFPDPSVYRYDRFLANNADPASFFPFGLGARRCIGAGLSMFTMRATLCALLSRFEFEATGNPARPQRQHVTIKPSKDAGLMVRAL